METGDPKQIKNAPKSTVVIQKVESVFKEYKDNPKLKFLNIFKILRYDFTDEIPANLVGPSTNSEYKIFKCRKGFFLTIVRYANSSYDLNLFTDPTLLLKYNAFKVFEEGLRIGPNKKTGQNLVTAKEIQIANTFLDDLIAELEK